MLHIKKFTFNPFQTNTYVVYSPDKKAIIVDASCYSQDERMEIDEYLEQEKLNVLYLVNTHCHVDHIFGNPYFKEKYNVDLMAHKEDEFLIHSAKDHALTFGLPIKEVSNIDRFIEDHAKLKIGNEILKAIHVPGHSPGSLAFYNMENKILIAGDVLFEGSIGRTDLPGGSYEQLISGIQSKLMVLPEDTTVYCGHGNETTIGQEKRTNPFLI